MTDWTDIASLTALSTVGDISLKYYSLGNHPNGFILGLGCYTGIVMLQGKYLGREGVAYTNNMWNVGTSIIETAAGIYLGEEMTNLNLFGVVLIIIGAMFLNQGRN